jgi:glycine/D-amino acid oxidase-like deaminating enzyme
MAPSALDRAPVPVPSAAAEGCRHEIYWRGTEPVEPGPPLEGEVRCDVCIVGGGYTGMWTAYFLKQAEPSLDVRIVEADYAGAGASGHNDGFATPTIGHSLSGVVRRFGRERAKVAYAAIGRSLLELGRFCRKEGVDAELQASPIHFVATRPEQLHRLERDVELATELGAQTTLLDGERARAEIGSPAIQGAVKQAGALINPHKLARGLARVVRDGGVEIYERTPATALARAGALHIVRTPGGTVAADRLLLATNAYQHQFSQFRRQVKPVWSYAMVSDPIPDEWLQELPWPERNGFVEARNFIVFARLTAENRLLIGGGPAPYFYGRDMEERHMRGGHAWTALSTAFARYFPAWTGLRFPYAYGGCVAITRNLVPRVGEFGDGVYYAYGYCGNGITNTHTVGKALRDLILERESNYANLLFVRATEPRFPPEPLAWAGAKLLSRALAWQDRHPHLLKRELV